MKKAKIRSLLVYLIIISAVSANLIGLVRTDIVSAQSGYDYFVVDTAQNSCFNNSQQISCPQPGQSFYGQDAQYEGNMPSYQDNNDGTVTDLNTGLMWQQTPDLDYKKTFSEAISGAGTLSLGGYDDWRLPTIKELYSLIDFNGIVRGSVNESVPFLDTDYFDFAYGDESSGERLIDAQYWSSTIYVGSVMDGSTAVFGVNFADGRIKGYGIQNPMGEEMTQFVRYVRGNSEYGINSFADNNDGTITDLATGLIWQKTDNGSGVTWEDALLYCENLDNGYDDWRLPDSKELQSIVDYTRAPDATSVFQQGPAIDPIFDITSDDSYFWTSTTHMDGPNNWGSYISFGEAWGYMEQPPNSGNYVLMNVHGAGAQRSDPKTGDPASWPNGNGPQGDVVRVYNYARCVRTNENEAPTISIIEPNGFNDTADLSYEITWSDSDADDDSIISLYYDTDNTGEDGILIAGSISEDAAANSYTWDTSGVSDGDYYVYGVIDDGVNPQAVDYSSGPVSVAHGAQDCTTLLCNPSFEDALNYWVTKGTFNNQVSDDAVDGTYSLYSEHVLAAGSNPSWSGVSQEISAVEPAQTYGLSMWAKSLNAGQGHVKIKWYDSLNNVSQVDYPIININGTNSSWMSFSKLITSPSDAVSAELFIWHGVNSSAQNIQGSTLWIDNIEFDIATTSCGTLCNESFEHGTLYWTVSGQAGSNTIETAGAYEGTKTLKSEQMYTGTDSAKWAGVTQFAQVTGGTVYRFRAWLKTLNASNGHVRVRWRDVSGHLLGTQYPITGINGTDGTWFYREANLTAPISAVKAEVTIWHGVTGGITNVQGSTVWVDDITFICQDLCNGGFEDGNVHWEMNGLNEGEIITTGIQEGAQSMKTAQSLLSTDNTQWAGISQRVTVAGGSSYNLSFWMKKENLVQGHLKAVWRDADDQVISTEYPVSGLSGSGLTWFEVSTILAAPANAETVELFIWHGVDGTNQNATGSTLYLDDITLAKNP